MSANKTTDDINTAAEQAEEVENQAQDEPDEGSYTHTFKRPFTYQGVTIETLTFDWDALTGEDHVAIENELVMRGKTLVVPEFTGEFLYGMAVRACVDRTPDGFRVLDRSAMKAMPLRDFQAICKKARSFLLRVES